MILGTVQLGVDYGINNQTGKPLKDEAFSMLDYAYDNGIEMLDTGPMYGNSEEVIGEYLKTRGMRFLVSTKLPDHIANEINPTDEEVHSIVSDSLRRISVKKLHCYYLHQFYQCKYRRLMDSLVECKRRQLIDNVGVSIYHPEELDYICEELENVVDIVQIPYNVFSVGLWDDALYHAKQVGITVYARSVFLQGLAFKDPSDRFVESIGATDYLEFVNELANDRNCSIQQLCFDIVKENEYIEDVLLGCETIHQLMENIALEKQYRPLEEKQRLAIAKTMSDIPRDVLNPQTWNMYY